jgi:hypothetical protein
MKTVLTQLATERRSDWRFTTDDISTFAIAVDKRIRTMCRHYTQALARPNVPKWAQTILGAAGEAGEAGTTANTAGALAGEAGEAGATTADTAAAPSSAASSASRPAPEPARKGKRTAATFATGGSAAVGAATAHSAPAAATRMGTMEWFVGFDAEQNQAWRVRGDAQSFDMKEYTTDIFYDKGAPPTDCAKARWPDGFIHDIAAVSVARWAEHISNKTASRGAPAILTLHGYIIRMKPDRSPLIWLAKETDRSRQICQIKIASVQSMDDAIALMTRVVETLHAGDDGTEPNLIKDRVMREYFEKNGSSGTVAATRKRPAAAEAAGAEGAPATSSSTPKPGDRAKANTAAAAPKAAARTEKQTAAAAAAEAPDAPETPEAPAPVKPGAVVPGTPAATAAPVLRRPAAAAAPGPAASAPMTAPSSTTPTAANSTTPTNPSLAFSMDFDEDDSSGMMSFAEGFFSV